jgi:hypothetical protein
MIRRVVLILQSGIRQIQGLVDAEAKDLPSNPEGHSLVKITDRMVLYKESDANPTTE